MASVVTGCEVVSSIANPLNFTGREFLTFYFWLSIIVVLLAFCLRNYLRLPDGNLGQQAVSLDAYEAAYLAGMAIHPNVAKIRVVDTAIASLFQKKYVTLNSGQRTFTLNGSIETLSHPIEQAVANAIPAFLTN